MANINGKDGQNDFLFGTDDNDFIDGLTGDDSMFGKAGNDEYFVDSIKDVVNESFNNGTDTVFAGVSFSLNANVENLTLVTNFHSPTADMFGVGNELNNEIIGNEGNNVLIGGAGSDTLTGDQGSNFLDGGAGIDTLLEQANVNFTLSDTVLIAPGFTDHFEDIEKFQLRGGDSSNIQDASRFTVGSIILNGEAGNDTLFGGAKDDFLTGDAGSNLLDGGAGTDTVFEVVTSSATLINTSLTYLTGNDTFKNIEKANLIGVGDNTTLDASKFTLGSVFLDGRGKNLTLLGGTKDDRIDGSTGNDILAGGSGDDNLFGDLGQDKFVYNTGAAFNAAAFGVDFLDFRREAGNTDKIVLDKTTFTSLKSSVGDGFSVASEFAVVTSDSAAATSTALITYNSNNNKLFYNQNGSAAGFGTGAQFANTGGSVVLAASDFIIQSGSTLGKITSLKSIINGSSKSDTLTGTDLSGILNGFAGNDKLFGNGGDDDIFGGDGKDIIYDGTGADFIEGNKGNDKLYLGYDQDIDTVIYHSDDGKDKVYDFQRGAGGDRLQFEGISNIDVVTNGCSTFFRLSDGIAGNSGFGSGQLLAELRHTTGFTADNIGLNLAGGNQAHFLFG